MYNLETQSYSYNEGHTSSILVCEDDAGVKQTYAIVFEDTGQQVEEGWDDPLLAGKTLTDKIKTLDKILKDMYEKEERKSVLNPSYKPDYERVFLQFCFGTNISLYKANSDLTNWSKLTISDNSDTAIVNPTNCD